MKRLTLLALTFFLTFPAVAAGPFTGRDYSGVYDCTGDDAKEGKYTGIVTLQLNNEQSSGAYGAYDFKLVVPDYGTYPGQAVSWAKRWRSTLRLPIRSPKTTAPALHPCQKTGRENNLPQVLL